MDEDVTGFGVLRCSAKWRESAWFSAPKSVQNQLINWTLDLRAPIAFGYCKKSENSRTLCDSFEGLFQLT